MALLVQHVYCQAGSLLFAGSWAFWRVRGKWRTKNPRTECCWPPFCKISTLDWPKGGPAAGKRKVGSCKSEREVAGPLFEEIGPLSGVKAAQQLENRTRPQADPRKKAARPLFEGLQLLSCQKRGPTANKLIWSKTTLPDPFLQDFSRWAAKKGPGSFNQKQQWRKKSTPKFFFSMHDGKLDGRL